MFKYLKKYTQILVRSVSASYEYRAQLAGIVIQETVSVGSILILWIFIFSTRDSIGSYSFNDTVLYYIFIPIVGFMTKASISNKHGPEIKDGDLSKDLLKPYNFSLGYVFQDLGKKINWLLLTSPLYVLIYFIVSKSINVRINPLVIAPFLLIVIFALGMNLIFDLLVTWTAFWFDDVWSFTHFKRVAVLIFGGVRFPFDLIPENIRYIFEILPFKFLYYIPNSYLIGTRGTTNLIPDLLQVSIWAIIFYLFGQLLLNRGLKKYGAFGN